MEDEPFKSPFLEVGSMGKVVGIDLGTTSNCVSVMEGGKPTAIANTEGLPPSVVAYPRTRISWWVRSPNVRR